MIKKYLLSTVCAAAAAISATQASALDEITVAYFLEWPMPFQFAKANGTYEEEMGVKINWVSFDTGTAMSCRDGLGRCADFRQPGRAALRRRNASAGQDHADRSTWPCQLLPTTTIALSGPKRWKSTSQQCRRPGRVQKVAVPLGTAAHYGFLSSRWTHFGVPLDQLDGNRRHGACPMALPRSPRATVDMACGWGGCPAPDAGTWQRAADRRRKAGAGHPGLRRDLAPRPGSWLKTPMWCASEQVPGRDRRGQRDVELRARTPMMMLPVIAQGFAGMDVDATAEATIATFSVPQRLKSSCPRRLARRRRAGLHEGCGRRVRRMPGQHRFGARYL